MRSTLHIFCKFGLALVRTSLVVFRLALSKKKKKKKASDTLIPIKKLKSQQSLHIFCKRGPAPVPGSDLQKKKKSAVRSTLHIFCKFGSALVRTSLVVFRLALRKKKKKGQRHPHSHQLTEVSNPYTFSLSEAQHLFQVQTFSKKKKKCGAVDPPHFL